MHDEEWVAQLPEMNFRQLMAEVCWNWQPCGEAWHEIERFPEGDFCIDKLYIGPTHVSYKTENWKISQEVFDKFVKFYETVYPLLEEREPPEKSL
jgi:hypothetical protein